MDFIVILLAAALVFGVCYLVDKAFAKLFRSKAQHMSGLAVRVSKRYGSFGLVFMILGIIAVITGITDGWVLTAGGVVVGLMGAGLAAYYLTYGIFYDEDSFLVAKLGRKSVAYQYNQIKGQMLYVSGGSVIIELHMTNGKTVSVRSDMDGAYAFLDKAFAGWCRQKGVDPENCDFHDPDNSLWFPQE